MTGRPEIIRRRMGAALVQRGVEIDRLRATPKARPAMTGTPAGIADAAQPYYEPLRQYAGMRLN